MTNNMTAAQTAQQNNRDGGGRYTTKVASEVEEIDLDDETQHHALYDVAAHRAAVISEAGVREQVKFLRSRGHGDEWIRLLAEEEDALDDVVLDAAESMAASTYNHTNSVEQLENDFEFNRWSTNSAGFDKTHDPNQQPLSMKPGTTTEHTYVIDGESVTFRVGYTEEVPQGDNGFRAHGYKQGEYYVSSEYGEARDWLPASFVTSPFKDGEGFAQRDHAWEAQHSKLVEAARRTVLARKSDPLSDLYGD